MKTRKKPTKRTKSPSSSKLFSGSVKIRKKPKSRKTPATPAQKRRSSRKTPAAPAQKRRSSRKHRKNSHLTHGDQILLAHYAGKNHAKLFRRHFNFAAFCFGTWYFFYRQMFLTGLILFAAELALYNLLQLLPVPEPARIPLGVATCTVYALFHGLVANPLYRRYATKKVLKIKANHRASGFDQLQRLCFYAGGPRAGQLFAGILIELAVGITITVAIPAINRAHGAHLPNFTFFGATLTAPTPGQSETTHLATSGDPDSIFAGTMLSDTSYVITDELSIDLPAVFQKSPDTAAQFRYEYTSPASFYNVCRVNISTPESYADGDLLVNQIAAYTNNGLATLTYRTTVNGIDWTYFSTKQAPGKIYYYGTTKGDQAYLLEYDVETSAPADCEKYLQEVLNSIKFKE